MCIAVGVDTGKARHQAAAYDPQSHRIVGQLGFSVDRAGFERFRQFLEHLARVKLGGHRSRAILGAQTAATSATAVNRAVTSSARLKPASSFTNRPGRPKPSDAYDLAALASVLPYVNTVTTDSAMKAMLTQTGIGGTLLRGGLDAAVLGL
jgi:hypothetical protein